MSIEKEPKSKTFQALCLPAAQSILATLYAPHRPTVSASRASSISFSRNTSANSSRNVTPETPSRVSSALLIFSRHPSQDIPDSRDMPPSPDPYSTFSAVPDTVFCQLRLLLLCAAYSRSSIPVLKIIKYGGTISLPYICP